MNVFAFWLLVLRLLVIRVWYRTLAGIRRMCSGGASLETSTTPSSPATRLPHEIIELIMTYIIYDIRSLRACSLTCCSWHIAAIPHLYHTLTIYPYISNEYFQWPICLLHRDALGLLPLVKRFRVYGHSSYYVNGLSPMLFLWCLIRRPLTLTLANVQELEIKYLDIPTFIPWILWYSRNFLPIVRSLALTEPKGSHRHVICFIGLFQNLQDLKILYSPYGLREDPVDDLRLMPPFTPPLRGQLTMRYCKKVDILKGMIVLFGGIRFCYMDLFYVNGMQLLLDACVETLETVVLNPADPRVGRSLQDFDLSRNKSLRVLGVPASSITAYAPLPGLPDTISFLGHLLSTITSPAFSKVIVLYNDDDFRGVGYWDLTPPEYRRRHLSRAAIAEDASRHRGRLEILRRVHNVWGFQLELWLSLRNPAEEAPVRILEEAIAEGKAKKVFCDFFSSLSVMYDPQSSPPDF